jgi:hypothetical protein
MTPSAPDAVGEFLHPGHGVLHPGVDDIGISQGAGPLQLFVRHLGDDDPGAEGMGHHGVEHAHGAYADDHDVLARPDAQLDGAAHSRGDGLQERADGGVQLLVHLDQVVLGNDAVIAEAPAAPIAVDHGMGALGHGAHGAAAGAAVFADAAAHAAAEADAVAHLVGADFFARRDDVAAALVARRHGEAHVVAQAVPLLVVGGADVAGQHPDGHVLRAHFAEGLGVHLRPMGLHNDAHVPNCRYIHKKSLLFLSIQKRPPLPGRTAPGAAAREGGYFKTFSRT